MAGIPTWFLTCSAVSVPLLVAWALASIATETKDPPKGRELLGALAALAVGLLAALPTYAGFMNDLRDTALMGASAASPGAAPSMAKGDWLGGAAIGVVTVTILLTSAFYLLRSVRAATSATGDMVAISCAFVLALSGLWIVLAIGLSCDCSRIWPRLVSS